MFNDYAEIKQGADLCRWIAFNKPNAKGEKMQVEIAQGRKNKLYCSCFVEDADGCCFSKYNPQIGKDNKIDFQWLLENSPGNEQKLIDEIAGRFYGEK